MLLYFYPKNLLKEAYKHYKVILVSSILFWLVHRELKRKYEKMCQGTFKD